MQQKPKSKQKFQSYSWDVTMTNYLLVITADGIDVYDLSESNNLLDAQKPSLPPLPTGLSNHPVIIDIAHMADMYLYQWWEKFTFLIDTPTFFHKQPNSAIAIVCCSQYTSLEIDWLKPLL